MGAATFHFSSAIFGLITRTRTIAATSTIDFRRRFCIITGNFAIRHRQVALLGTCYSFFYQSLRTLVPRFRTRG